MLKFARQWTRSLKRDVHALWLASRDPRTPWYAKAVAAAVTAYVFSPVDLIPDFIPVLGLVDDLVIVPLGIVLALRLVPADVMAEHRATANLAGARPVSRVAAAVIVLAWIGGVAATAWFFLRR